MEVTYGGTVKADTDDQEVGLLFAIVKLLEVLPRPARERIAVYLYDRYTTTP